MPNSLPLVQLQLLTPLLNGLIGRGVDPDPILGSVGLTREAVDKDGSSVHVMVVHQFVENCALATNDPTFCAQIGSLLDPTGWPMVRMAIDRAKTLGDFLNIYVAQATKVASSVTPFLEVRGTLATFGETRRFEPLIEPAQNDGFMIGLTLTMLERALGESLDPEQILLVVSDPSVLHSRFEPFQVVRGNNMGARVQFPSDWLSIPIAEENTQAAHTRTTQDLMQDPFLSGLRTLLMQNIGLGGLSADQVARLVHLNPRKLSRQLSKLGTSISEELIQAKMDYAKKALTKSEHSIEDIAGALGYSEPSNFSRAFARVEKMAPTRFREQFG